MPIPAWALAMGGAAAAGAFTWLKAKRSAALEDALALLTDLDAELPDAKSGKPIGRLQVRGKQMELKASGGELPTVAATVDGAAPGVPVDFTCLIARTVGDRYRGRIDLGGQTAQIETNALLWWFCGRDPKLFEAAEIDRLMLSNINRKLTVKATMTREEAGERLTNDVLGWLAWFAELRWQAESPGDFWLQLSQMPTASAAEREEALANAAAVLGKAEVEQRLQELGSEPQPPPAPLDTEGPESGEAEGPESGEATASRTTRSSGKSSRPRRR